MRSAKPGNHLKPKFHQGVLTMIFFCDFSRHRILKREKVDPTFSSFNPCPSVATDCKKQFQSLNLVFNYNKTEPLFLKFNLAFLKLKELRCDIVLLSKCLQLSDQGTIIASLKIERA